MTGDREYIVSGIRRLKGRTFKALLGKGDSGHTVAVAGKANYVWIRLKAGSSLGAPVQALNRNVPPIHGRVIRVREIDRAGIKGFEVIDFDDAGTPYYHDDTGHNVLPKHGWTHECSQDSEATDPVNLYTRCWAELRVEPTDPCSMYTYVTHGWYMCEIPQWFPGGNSPAFTAPAAGTSRYDLVYIDCSGTVGIVQGDNNMPALNGPLPEPPDFTIPLAAILFTGTAGCIQEDMILDCRVMPNLKYPPGGARFDDSITPSMIYPDLAPWPGIEDYPSRTDHKHGADCAVANTIVPDATAAEGASTSFSRADHTHGIVCNIPGMIHAVDTASLEGTGTSFARADHIHGLNVAAPVSVGLANAEGGSTEFVRRDHIHQGVHSLAESGQAALYGDITLSEGLNILLTEAGQDIAIATRTDPTFVTGTFTGYLNVGEDLTVAHNIYAGDGLVGTPSHSFTSDPDTGMYSMAANRLGFATAGVQALEIDASQVLWIGSTKDTNLYRSAANILKTDDKLQCLGIGINTAATGAEVTGAGATGASCRLTLFARSDTATDQTTYEFYRRRDGVPLVLSGDALGRISFFGYDSAEYREAARISAQVDAGAGAGDMPGRLRFYTTPDGSVTPAERLRIDNAGIIWFNPSVAVDTNLYRNAANILKTDDEFWAVGPLSLTDGIVAPGALAGAARIYVDTADGDLKVVFADGFVATLAADS